MAFNAQSYLTDPNNNPFRAGYQQSGYSPITAGTAYDTTPMMPNDPYAGASYTGPQDYTPPQADPADYWNEATSGYSDMPQYDPSTAMPFEPNYDTWNNVTQNLGPDAESFWAQQDMYAPWSGYSPAGNEATSAELLYGNQGLGTGGYEGGNQAVGFNPGVGAFGGSVGGGFGSGAATGAAFGPVGALAGALFGGLGGFLGMKGKKRPTYTLEHPSYQGYMFTPEEGFPNYYAPSLEGSGNQTQQDIYSTTPQVNNDAGMTQPQTYDYNYTGGGDNQSYVGQQDQNYGSLYNNQNPLYQTFTV